MFLPRFVPVLQQLPHRALPEISNYAKTELSTSQIGTALRPGARVAIGVGSRGVSNITELVQATVCYFQSCGLQPFVFPAMGSHGGATAEGQRAVLEHYGITEASIGCPVTSCLDVVPFGRTAEGIETWMDTSAHQADGIFLINRVKWHTSFDGPTESGLLKMSAIGLGKARGAAAYHTHATRIGMFAVLQSVGRHMIASGKLLGGLAVIEDAYHDTAGLRVLPASEIEAGEAELLARARQFMPRIPFDEVDILIIDEMGKEISGTGMDSKVVNRHPQGQVNPWPWAPTTRRIYVRDLTALTCGNAIGVGMADLISERLFQKIDWNATRVNGLTASNLNGIRTPIRSDSDRDALQMLVPTVGRIQLEEVTFVRIKNTLELTHIWASENLVDSGNPKLDSVVFGSPFECTFDSRGDFTDFPGYS